MGRQLRRFLSAMVFVLLFGGLLLSIHIAGVRAERTATDSAYNILTDSAKEQSAILAAVLNGEFNTLRGICVKIDTHTENNEELCDYLTSVTKASGMSAVNYISADGIMLTNDGKSIDVSDRNYFNSAMQGSMSIEVVNKKVSQELAVILAVPCPENGIITGVLTGVLASEELRNVLTSQVYGGLGYSLIVDSSGNIIVNIELEYVRFENGSIFDFYNEAEFEKGFSLENIKQSMKAGESCMFGYTHSGVLHIAAAVPFTDTVLPDVDWYVLNIVDGSELKSEISQNRRNSLEVLIIVAAFTMLSMAIFAILEFDSNRRLKRTARAAMLNSENMRLNEEQFRIVAKQSGRNVYRYNIQSGTVTGKCLPVYFDFPNESSISEIIEYAITSGAIAPESAEDYREFFQKIDSGVKKAEGVFLVTTGTGEHRWFRHTATTLLDRAGKPLSAIISYYDYTEQREREVAYLRWQHELSTIPDSEMALYEWNLSRDYAEDSHGLLASSNQSSKNESFNSRSEYFCNNNVYPEDRGKFRAVMNRDNLLGLFTDKCYSVNTDYRYIGNDEKTEWRNISVQLVSYPDTQDIKAYIMNRDIDRHKRREDDLIIRSERDNVTGVYNRATFITRVEELFFEEPEAVHALIILDIDGFKTVNDTLGHAAGDRVLTEYAGHIRSVLRSTDIVGRIGGDEFMICLPDMNDSETIDKKAQQLCSLLRRRINEELTISVSMGIAAYPSDGKQFAELYEKVDSALYKAKNSGKNRFVRYSSDSQEGTDINR